MLYLVRGPEASAARGKEEKNAMEKMMTLRELKAGETARIEKVGGEGALRDGLDLTN